MILRFTLIKWPGTQEVREWSAKPFYAGANPAQASFVFVFLEY